MLARGLSLSFIDVICCSLGAVLLLFFLFSLLEPPTSTTTASRWLVVRIQQSSGAKVQLGLEYQAPNADWQRVSTSLPLNRQTRKMGRDAESQAPIFLHFSADSGPDSGGVATVILREPSAGIWQFRGYIADLPENRSSTPIEVTFQVWGVGERLPESPNTSSRLQWPGDTSTVMSWVVPVFEPQSQH